MSKGGAALSPLGMSKPPVTLSPTGRGKAPAAMGTPTPAKAAAMAAAGKAHPAAAGAVPPPAGAAPAAAKGAPATQGADAFIYEEYGFPSAAEPVPAANPLLIFSVLVSYFLFVAACFLIIKYAYQGYDVNAPDVGTVTSKDIHAPLQFDEKDLEDNPSSKARRFADGHASGRRRGSTAAHGRLKAGHGRGKKGARKPARSKRVRQGTSASAWENERVTMMGAEVDYAAEALNSTPAAVQAAGRHRRGKTTVSTAETDADDDHGTASTSRRTVRPKNLNKSG